MAAGCWEQDENGLTYHLDGNGNIEYNAWVQENGGWKYADESGHMVTSVTKSIDGVEYTFGADGYMKEGSERAAAEFTLGTLEGNHYRNTGRKYLYELLGRYDTFLPGGSYCYDRKWQCPDLCPGWRRTCGCK